MYVVRPVLYRRPLAENTPECFCFVVVGLLFSNAKMSPCIMYLLRDSKENGPQKTPQEIPDVYTGCREKSWGFAGHS